MEYIINETPVRTSNNYKINDLKVELDMPTITKFGKYEISNSKYTEYDSNSFESKIGFSFDKCHNLDIDIYDDVNILYDIKEDILIDQIKLNLVSSSNVTIKYTSLKDTYHHFKLIISGKASGKINLINNISSNSKSFIAIENYLDKESNVTINYIDLGGNLRVSNYYALLKEKGVNKFNNIYVAKGEDRIDMNYYIANLESKSEGYINTSGVLKDNAYKTFKGTIEFMEGSSKSVGKELENTILLSETSKSRSLPMLLCHEEDVEGAHGVATGKIDSDKLFYLMSRGLNSDEAKKLIIKGDFNNVLNDLDDDLKTDLVSIIDNIL